jgi:L-amino acid N-acyltransferase YncA
MTIQDTLNQKYPDIRFELYQNDTKKTIFLTGFIVPVKLRNQGIGTKLMNDLTRLADEHGFKITLTPSDSYGGNVTKLKDFYQRFGFVFNKGKNRDFTHMEDMYRLPKTTELTEEEDTTQPSSDSESSSGSGNSKATGKKWETGVVRGHANPISNHGEWETGLTRGHANPVTTNENTLNEQIKRMKNLTNIFENFEAQTAVIEITKPLAYMNLKNYIQAVPYHATKEDLIFINKGASGAKSISTKNIKVLKVFNSENTQEIEEFMNAMRNKL